MRRCIVYLIDQLIAWRDWWSARRDTIGRLQEQIRQLKIEHQSQVDARESKIRLQAEEINMMADMNTRNRKTIAADIAELTAAQARATVHADRAQAREPHGEF